VDTAGLRRKAKVQEKLEEALCPRFHPRHHLRRDRDPGDGRDPPLRDPGPADRRSCPSARAAGLVFVPGQMGTWWRTSRRRWPPSSTRRSRQLPQVRRARRLSRLPRRRPGAGSRKLMPAVFKTHGRLVDQGEDPRPQRLAAHGHRAPPRRRRLSGRRIKAPSTWPRPKSRPADLRAVRQPRRPACRRAIAATWSTTRWRESFRAAGRADPDHREVQQENPYGRGARRSPARARRGAPFGESLPKTGLKAKTADRRPATKAQGPGAGGASRSCSARPSPRDPRPRARQPGAGRAAKACCGPASKPKRASPPLPPSSGRRPR